MYEHWGIMSEGQNKVGGMSELYAEKLQELEERARAVLIEHQAGDRALVPSELNVADLGEVDFPRKAVEAIRDSDLLKSERHELITYLLGCWYQDNIGGTWTYVPMPVEQSALYLGFGIGIANASGTVLANVAETARGILEGADMDFEEVRFKIDVKLEKSSPGEVPGASEG